VGSAPRPKATEAAIDDRKEGPDVYPLPAPLEGLRQARSPGSVVHGPSGDTVDVCTSTPLPCRREKERGIKHELFYSNAHYLIAEAAAMTKQGIVDVISFE
jgi:hypothetical protein